MSKSNSKSLTFPIAALVLAAGQRAHAQATLYDFPAGYPAAGGDVNGDGARDFLVGSLLAQTGAAAHVRAYSGATGALLFDAVTPAGWHSIGEIVGNAGDVDADGHDDVLACARTAAGGGGFAVVIYSGANGAMLQVVQPTLPLHWFGAALVTLGDIDGDARPDFAVGCEGANASVIGFVRIVSGATGATIRDLAPPAGAVQQAFGQALDAFPDLDGDGRTDVLIGSPQLATGASGYAFIVSSATGAVLRQWTNTNPASGSFGYAVATLGDADGDGVADVAVGDPSEVFGYHHTGSVRVYSGASGLLLRRWIADPATLGMGWDVSAIGDQDGDGLADVLFVGGGSIAGCCLSIPRPGRIASPMSGATLEDVDEHAGVFAALDDVDGDGSPDYMAGYPELYFAGQLIYRTTVVLTRHAAPTLGIACGWYPNTNSLGCEPRLATTGSASLTIGDELTVYGDYLRGGQSARLYWSFSSIAAPFANQTLCVRPNHVLANTLTGAASAQCTGTFVVTIPKSSMLALGWSAGSPVYIQSIARDPGYLAHNEISLTNALAVPVWP